MTPAPAQLAFVSSLFASKIFWTQVVTLLAMILSAAGYHVINAPGAQEQIVGGLDAIATMALRLFAATGPVSLAGPASTPPPQDVPVGASVVTVAAPADAVQVTHVQPLDIGVHTVAVAAPALFSQVTPASVIVTPAQ
jgi:hypothetical protein